MRNMRSTIRGQRARLLNGPLTLGETIAFRTRLRILMARTPRGLRSAVARAFTGRNQYWVLASFNQILTGRRPLFRATQRRMQRLLDQCQSDPITIARLGLSLAPGPYMAIRRAAALQIPDPEQDSTT